MTSLPTMMYLVKTGCISTKISTIRYGKRRSTIINPAVPTNPYPVLVQ